MLAIKAWREIYSYLFIYLFIYYLFFGLGTGWIGSAVITLYKAVQFGFGVCWREGGEDLRH